MRKFENFVLPDGMNICSVNLDREINFLTLFSVVEIECPLSIIQGVSENTDTFVFYF